jgi:hypothetical protein
MAPAAGDSAGPGHAHDTIDDAANNNTTESEATRMTIPPSQAVLDALRPTAPQSRARVAARTLRDLDLEASGNDPATPRRSGLARFDSTIMMWPFCAQPREAMRSNERTPPGHQHVPRPAEDGTSVSPRESRAIGLQVRNSVTRR